jgi:ABC-type multidrug transport system ATPase subunit
LLKVSNLTKDYGKFRALDHVSFTIEKGGATLLIGPNGAGKTTIVKSILGLLRYSGEISVDGKDIFADGGRSHAKIGYVPQALMFGYNTSLDEQASFVASLKCASRESARDALKRANLWEIRKRKVNSLSHGMKQKFGIALALLNDPPLLIFDEPINNVDLQGQLEFRKTLRELTKQGKTLLVSTHLSGLSELIGSAIVLHKGKVVAQGTPQELLAKMNAADTLYLRVNNAETGKVLEVVKSYGKILSQNDEWIVFSLPPGMKGRVLAQILSDGLSIKDLIIEPSTIESRYVKLLDEVPN